MKLRQAWKIWGKSEKSPQFGKAIRTIETRTRRHYRKWGKVSNYSAHIAESYDLMWNILYKDGGNTKVGKSYRIWRKPKKEE